MTASEVQIWVGIVGTLVTIIAGVQGVLRFQRRRDVATAVGTAFRDTVDNLASDNPTKQMAAAILLRRFFDAHAEQGTADTPYAKEAVGVIAGLLRQADTGQFQKVLADGLRDAPSLRQADLQGCNLAGAFLGTRAGDSRTVDLSGADLYAADLSRASLRGIRGQRTVFYEADLTRVDLEQADLTAADFREVTAHRASFAGAKLDQARFTGATLTSADFSKCSLLGADFSGADLDGASFDGAVGLPDDVKARLARGLVGGHGPSEPTAG